MIVNAKRDGIRTKNVLSVFLIFGWIGLCSGAAWPPSRLDKYLAKGEEWFGSRECKTAADNILSWQDDYGTWPKNVNTAYEPFSGERKDLHGTFDNGATTGEMRFLARAYRATQESRYQEAFLKALDLILKAQYPTGGWPQSYPVSKTYSRHITFNDNAMVRLMILLDEAADSPMYDFVDQDRRAAAGAAFDRGIGCILKCQIRVNGQLTVWCAQHDEKDYSPRQARSYELASLSGGESAEILRLLMRLEDPAPPVVRAITAGVRWYRSSRVEGIRIRWVSGRRTAVQDPQAPPCWARFYEIDTNRPFFCDRDGVPKYDYNEIDPERTEGYAWYGDWGREVLKEYESWREKWKDRLADAESVVLVIVGDSTVCDFPEADWRHGWGEYIQDYFSDAVKVINLARSGRSTKTYLNEGLWEKALLEKPAFILIQFGHNDDHAPGRPESTEADTEYSDNLRRYVEEAGAIGAVPVLITPVHRRKFDTTGRLKDTLLPYANAMKKVAGEKKAAVVDLHTSSGELFLKLGETGCENMANDPADRTHFNEQGARAIADLVMNQLPKAEPVLKTYLRDRSG